MSDVSLSALPVELLHHVFDYLNVETILLKVRLVCKKLHGATYSYGRLKLELKPIDKHKLRLICRIIRPTNIIALTLSDRVTMRSKFDTLFSRLDLSQCTRLKVLTIDNPRQADLEHFLQSFIASSLVSLSIDFFDTKNISIRNVTLLSSVLAQPTFRKLNLRYPTNWRQQIPLPVQCTLNYLSISSCNASEYLNILGRCPNLRTLIIGYCTINNTDYSMFSYSASTYHQQLKSLTIDDCELPTMCLGPFLSLTPSLIRLKLVSSRTTCDSVFNGSFWMDLVQKKLPSLHNFEFFFNYHLQNSDNYPSMSLFITSFRSSFWLNDKHWFVTCDFNISASEITLYTPSFFVTGSDILIRCKPLSMERNVDISSQLLTNNMSNVNEPQVNMICSFV
jgi:hypothetical protein